MDWYKTMADAYDGSDGGASVKVGETKLTGGFFLLPGVLIAGFIALFLLRVWTGSTGWLGYREVSSEGANSLASTTLSGSGKDSDIGLTLPMLATPGQEIVVDYDLRPKTGTSHTFSYGGPAQVTIWCWCPHENWKKQTIAQFGKGEIVMPVRKRDFYRVQIIQSSARYQGVNSYGTYWLGVRQSGS